MSNPPPTRLLSAVPSLEQQKKLARELLLAARSGDAEALQRIRTFHPRRATAFDAPDSAQLSLHEAQLVIAREYGFASWPKLKAQIDSVLEARRTRIFVRDVSYHDDRAHGLLAVLPDGTPAVLEQVRAWHPAFAEAADEAIRSAVFTLDDARLVYARQHGFAHWTQFGTYLKGLGKAPDGEPFLAVFEAGQRGDWPSATATLRSHPEIVRVRGTNGNTLLNLACSLASCDAPDGSPEARAAQGRLAAVQLLLAAGAEVQQANDRGWTPLHQAAYRNDSEMAALLLQAGAPHDVSAHGDGGTPLAVALFWGHREVATVLAECGAVPDNLRVAAGLGRADLVQACFDGSGTLTATARAGRAFYRPHSGFPAWRPSDDPQEVLDEALVWAAKCDRTQVMPLLVARGAHVHADPYRGTPLMWAAANGHNAAVSWLLDHGADVNQRAAFGGPSHGEGVTALHLAAQNDHVAMVELLLTCGGDPMMRDALYDSTPAGWAEHEGAGRALTALTTHLYPRSTGARP